MTSSTTKVGSAMADTCPQAELIDAYVDGATTALERQQAERHLAECAECREEARSLSALNELLASERRAPAPFAVHLDMPARAPKRRTAIAAAAAMAALVGATAAVLAGSIPASASAASAVATLFDFVATIGLLGAGLLDASWRGVGAALSSAFGSGASGLVVGLVLALGLTGLLCSLFKPGGRATARQRPRR